MCHPYWAHATSFSRSYLNSCPTLCLGGWQKFIVACNQLIVGFFPKLEPRQKIRAKSFPSVSALAKNIWSVVVLYWFLFVLLANIFNFICCLCSKWRLKKGDTPSLVVNASCKIVCYLKLWRRYCRACSEVSKLHQYKIQLLRLMLGVVLQLPLVPVPTWKNMPWPQ